MTLTVLNVLIITMPNVFLFAAHISIFNTNISFVTVNLFIWSSTLSYSIWAKVHPCTGTEVLYRPYGA